MKSDPPTVDVLPPPDPESDRLPFEKKLTILAELGQWPKLEQLAKAYGWTSPEVRDFMHRHLPKAACAMCGKTFYKYTRRVKYCSDRCRRRAANEGIPGSHAERPKPQSHLSLELPTEGMQVLLEQVANEERERRYYLVQIVRVGAGEHQVLRQWWREGAVHRQTAEKRFKNLADALELFNGTKERCLSRGYSIVVVDSSLE
ncbi:MAG: WGR domain-containing protein [Chloroflexi bacterium]|nr:WGR domain-containing protein [Chloroflexota bacterium]